MCFCIHANLFWWFFQMKSVGVLFWWGTFSYGILLWVLLYHPWICSFWSKLQSVSQLRRYRNYSGKYLLEILGYIPYWWPLSSWWLFLFRRIIIFHNGYCLLYCGISRSDCVWFHSQRNLLGAEDRFDIL